LGRILFGIFLIVPLIEIAIFILLGQAVGLVPTLAGVVVTAIIGSLLIRAQGLSLLMEIRQLTARGRLPARQIAEGVMLAVAGALLLTPGYFTDTCGFLLLVPPVRSWLYLWLKDRTTVIAAGAAQRRPQHKPDIVDLEKDDWR